MTVVLVVCYNRLHNIHRWLDVWQRMSTSICCKLVFIITGGLPEVFVPPGIEVIRTDNAGYSTGAVKRFIDFRNDYDRLIWMPDDFLPLRQDLLQLFHSADVVGTFWSTTHHPHIRTGGISMTKEVAKALKFPPGLLSNSKEDEYSFEYGEFCFYDQVDSLGCSIKMLDGTTPPESPHWENTPHEYVRDDEFPYEEPSAVYVCPF